MASSGGSPGGQGRQPPRGLSYTDPRPRKRPVPRFGPGMDTELSLNTELRRTEEQIGQRSLPNNLGWSSDQRPSSAPGEKKGRHFEQVKLLQGTPPADFTSKKRHTPATVARTKFPPGTPASERQAIERLRQQLRFDEEQVPTSDHSGASAQESLPSPPVSAAANNERMLPLSRPAVSLSIPIRETNETDAGAAAVAADFDLEYDGDQVDIVQILGRLKQVRDFLKQATSMFINMSTGGSDEQRSSDFDQAAKLARLIKHLKTQEKAYTDLLQRTIAMGDDSTVENTPSVSMQSVGTEDAKSETLSVQDEELQGLQQQHALLQKMLEQQQQLKDLQSRQAALLTLQRDAEKKLAEAEEEGRQLTTAIEEGAVGGQDFEGAGGRSRSATDTSQLPGAAGRLSDHGGIEDMGLTPEQLALFHFMERNKEKLRARDSSEKDRDEKQGHSRKKKKNLQVAQAVPETLNPPSGSASEQPDNEEAALALADATQERLELENKLMALQAKKEQMDSLLRELQQLREAQLRKENLESTGPRVSSVNESRQDEEDEKPLATKSQKLDDDRILEALEVHEKLKKLQEVRDRLKQLRDLIGHYQPPMPGGVETSEDVSHASEQSGALEDSAPESGQAEDEEEGAVGGPAPGPSGNAIEWILKAGIEDPELVNKLKQLQAARERVLNLKQTNQSAQLATSRVHNETGQEGSVQTQTDSESEAVSASDTESNASSSLNALVWQDDPEFQDKIRKLNSAKQKLKQLQELVKRVQQFPDSTPTLPTELAELSFDDNLENSSEDSSDSSEDDDDDDDDNGDDDQDANDATVNQQDDDDDDDDDQDDDDEEQSILSEQAIEDYNSQDQEAEYQIRLQKQKNELERLLQERRRLLEMQQELTKMTKEQDSLKQTAANKQPSTSDKPIPKKTTPDQSTYTSGLVRTDTFTVHKPTISKGATAPVVSDSATQTAFDGGRFQAVRPNKSYSVDSGDPVAAGGTTSSALVWSELRRQRELHEEKLKRRKQRLLNEKRRKAGLDDVSEGGTYSLRSADMDEGFGVSMMSADITTATWGGSTQPSSTQNDSAVSEDGSDTEKITVEVEDEYPDGIVQAEEEEEEQDEPDAFPGGARGVFRSRERAPRSSYSAIKRSGKKRKLDGTTNGRKRDRWLTFDDWPRTYSDSSPRQRIREQEHQKNQFQIERQVWETQCNQLHQEISNLTGLCNNLLRDQQSLVSALIGRSNLMSPLPQTPQFPGFSGSNPFQQYQQRQQEAYQNLHGYFDQRRFLADQQHLMQTLNQCYNQLNHQQQELGFLQNQFQQLFPSASPEPRQPSPMMGFQPSYLSNPFAMPPGTSPTPGSTSRSMQSNPVPSHHYFTNRYSPYQRTHTSTTADGATPVIDLREMAKVLSSNFPAPSAPQAPMSAPSWMPVFTEGPGCSTAPTQTQATAANPDTGMPSPRFGGHPEEPAPHPRNVFSGFPSSSGYGTSTAKTSDTTWTARSYNPSVYSEPTKVTTASSSRQPPSAEVVGRTFPTPLRAEAVAHLAKKDQTPLAQAAAALPVRRGMESVETASHLSSVPGEDQDHNRRGYQDDPVSDAGSEFSLFEALRDSIYSEVATLISINESRPHFLIELFRELQLLTSDYLRQRGLYALRDIVTRFLTEDSLTTNNVMDSAIKQARFQAWMGSNSELTPSETVDTETEDESQAPEEDAVPAQVVTEGIYDYAEPVESGSTLSTPTSSQAGESPFASEGLGDTVIHLDQTLSKMREYERMREEGRLRELKQLQYGATGGGAEGGAVKDDVTTSSAGDVGSESSMSDVQYPRIDTQALDHQIKSIMAEVIPYLNEHMEDTCSMELLGYIRNLVLTRIRVKEEQEFGRFFHKQLSAILLDSLSKFEDKKMKDCGEDILVDMSEILFNELAFFRLMQDLDAPGNRARRPFWRQECESTTDTGTGQEGDKEDEGDADDKEQQDNDSAVEGDESLPQGENVEQDEDGDEDSSDVESSTTSTSEDSDAEDEAGAADAGEADDEMPMTKEQIEAEAENLGKSRDDDMAAQFQEIAKGIEDKDSAESQQCVKLALSVSESKPFTSAGSGEEDGEESYDDQEARCSLEDCEGGTAAGAAAEASRERRKQRGDDTRSDESDTPQDDQEQAAAARPEHLQNGQAEDDEFEVILDDLPTKLTGLTEADLQARIAEEHSRTEGVQGVLAQMDGEPELVGDPNALPESANGPVNGEADK
ncbi:pericentriolar material 1 protein isoform X2 [Nematostella vectensis]|uniref:pericentriolar material 1 protein isoform X2 n=1 Tax=Nematostella vectensis TaxID=45351 RepID=UPI0020776F81|nr:pericentriolar material 1 protein isoform X2 [Nematostella vectensis]